MDLKYKKNMPRTRKTITISQEAYDLLASMKKDGESFTEVIERALGKLKSRPLSSYAGRWKGSPGEIDGIQEEIEGMWKEYDQILELGT